MHFLASLTSFEDNWDQNFEREVKRHSTVSQTKLKQHSESWLTELDTIKFFLYSILLMIVRYSALEHSTQWLKFIFLKVMNSGAERFNGLMAMIGIVAGIGAYATTGQFIPGIF